MKIAVCLLVSMFAVAVSSSPANRASRVKRGFRAGAADRFSHGFGKRGELLEDSVNSIEKANSVMSTEGLLRLLSRDPELLRTFINTYIDTNEDGQISREELFSDKMA